MVKLFEVQTHTIADGWVNVWSDDGEPVRFITRFAAQRELDGFFRDLPEFMRDGYSREDYRVSEAVESAPFKPFWEVLT